jgi:hypothetical protein
MCMTQQEKCPECGTEFPEIDWDAEDVVNQIRQPYYKDDKMTDKTDETGKGLCVALAHQINGYEDVVLCSLKCLVGYLEQHGN